MSKQKPFNDVTDHYEKHVGMPAKVQLNKLPMPLRVIGYGIIGFGMLAVLTFISLFVYQLF